MPVATSTSTKAGLPGTGHLDSPALPNKLSAIGYDGYLALERRLRGQPRDAGTSVPAFLRSAGP